ncbi:MAG: amidohydrolase family protein [Gammaproteobacteria bacterium]|nr:amidohydrolase family protein [Gammaproteobacteria bacterium]
MHATAPRTILAASWLAIAGLAPARDMHAQMPPQRTTAFVNANVVPMDREGVLADYTVVVSSGRIVDMGPSASVDPPAGALVIDAGGKYLMPGLAEMHGHMPGGDIEETVMFLYVANGVTTVRGMLGQDGHLALRARANAGEIIAPTLYMAGPSFNDGSVNSPREAEEQVRRQQREGWDLLKIHPGPTLDEYNAMAVTAQEVGIRFAGHVPADVGLEHAILMGQETFDHLDGYIEYLDAFEGEVDEDRLQYIVQLTRDAGAWVVPTMVLWEVGIIGRGDADELAGYPEMRYWPSGQVWGWGNRQRAAASRTSPERAAQWAANRNRVLKALSDGGAGILLGTDSPQIFSVPGFSIHRELKAMADAGMSAWEILVSGTRNVGEYFQGRDAFGTVAVGRRADLLLLNANPLSDVANVADRAGVMFRGRWLPEEEIRRRLEEIADEMGN